MSHSAPRAGEGRHQSPSRNQMSFLPSTPPSRDSTEEWHFSFIPRILCLYKYDTAPAQYFFGEHEWVDRVRHDKKGGDADEKVVNTTLPISTWFDCITANTCPSDFFGRVHDINQFGWISTDVISGGSTRAPAALFVCRESRAEALKRYFVRSCVYYWRPFFHWLCSRKLFAIYLKY
jgi:hypothetical protein